MARSEVITGLDVGTTKVCALIAEITEQDQIQIIGIGEAPSFGMKKGVVVDIEATTKAIEEAITKASRQAARQVDAVYVGVTGDHIGSLNSVSSIAITHPDREITAHDVERVLEASRVIVLPPDRQILHAIPRSYTIDGQNGVRQPIGMSGTRLEVETHIVHGATTFIQNVTKCVERAGYEVAEEVLEPVATGEAVLLPAERQLGVCLVDIGGGTSDVAVFEHGSIFYSAVVPVGGVHVRNDVAYGLTVAHEEAERLKVQSGSAVADLVPEDEIITVQQVGREHSRKLRRRALVPIIQARMEELFELVKEELVRSDSLHRIPTGLVISGGGSQLRGCAEVAERVIGVPVRIGRPYGVGGLGNTLTDPKYATAVGLVLYGSHEVRTTRPQKAESGSEFVRSLRRWFRLFMDKFGV